MTQNEHQEDGERMFFYAFSPGMGKPTYHLNVPVNVIKTKKVEELAARIVNFHNIPCFVETGMRTSEVC